MSSPQSIYLKLRGNFSTTAEEVKLQKREEAKRISELKQKLLLKDSKPLLDPEEEKVSPKKRGTNRKRKVKGSGNTTPATDVDEAIQKVINEDK